MKRVMKKKIPARRFYKKATMMISGNIIVLLNPEREQGVEVMLSL